MTLQVYHLGEAYTAARATPALVGRQEILSEINDVIYNKDTTALLYITGAGGVGKTRLIRHVLAKVQDDKHLLAATELIDLYHTRNRSVGGLAESIVEVLTPLNAYIRNQSTDSEIDEKLEALAHAEQEGLATTEVSGRLRELSALLLEIINQYTLQHRLVLALDTAERLYVVRDEAQERLGLAAERPAVLEWLLREFLPNLNNTVVLIAGRPEPLNLLAEFTALTKEAQQFFLPIQLVGLTESDTLDYFAAVIARAQGSKSPLDKLAAESISRWSEEEKRTVFHCLHDGREDPRIRPILLALAIDHLVVEGHPLPALTRPLTEAQALTELERRQIEAELSKALVRTLREHHREGDDMIMMLGWLRKGADIALLQRLTEYSSEEIKKMVAQIRELSFVKIRPTDDRIFLHDEMYDILQHYALERVTPDETRHIFTTLLAYYAKQIQSARQHIRELYQPQADSYAETLPDPNEVRRTRAQLQDAIVEDLYYRLHWQPTEAFQQYVLYAEEALTSNDENLWMMLRAELFSFLGEQNPTVSAEDIEHLRKVFVVPDSAVRWVMWLWSRDQYQAGLQIADQIMHQHFDLIEPGGELARWYLNVWRGYLYTYTGDYTHAEPLLMDTVKSLVSWNVSNPTSIFAKGILARAYNSLGYYFSRRTQHYQAIKSFSLSAQLMQELGLYVDEASTLNNRAFDLARIGDFATAIPTAKAGLQLCEQLGPRAPVGLSLNTLGLIELSQFDLAGGMRDIKRAVELFQSVGSRRGLGLALIALAEAERRISTSVVYLKQGRSAQILEDAIAHTDQAIKIFTDEVQEPARLTEAWRKKANAYRDWAKLRRERPTIITKKEQEGTKQSVEKLAQQSHATFEEAKTLVGQDATTLVELLYDQALLFYYTRLYVGAPDYEQAQAELEKHVLHEIDQLIPSDFHVLPHAGSKLPRVWFGVQRSNVELLRGHLAFNRWSIDQRDDRRLYAAIEHYTAALTSYAYFSKHNFQERRQGLDELYAQLRPLTSKQKKQIHDFIHEIEKVHGLEAHESPMSEFFLERFGELDELAFVF